MSNSNGIEEGVAAPPPRISYAIARLHQLVFSSVSELAARQGLTALQFTTLSVLSRHGAPLSSSQLARRSFMTAQSMHEVIHRLEGEGLIERNPHPEHGRKLPASLTAKGRRVLSTCEAALADFEAQMLKGFSKADRTAFSRLVKAAVHNLGGGFALSGAGAGGRRGQTTAATRKTSPRKASRPAGVLSGRARALARP
jgi:DNA-binding MarR family transcriptional regulator